MRIILFNTEKTWGGGEKWFFDTARQFTLNKHKVFFFSNVNSVLTEKVQPFVNTSYQFKVKNLSFLNVFKLLSLAKKFKRINADAIIINLSADLKIAGLAAKMAGIKKIIYRRGSAKPIKDKFLNRFLFSNVITHVIANSEQTKKTILANNSNLFKPGKIKVIYNGIEMERYSKTSFELYSKSGKELVIGNAGRLSWEKGQERLLQLASELKKRDISFKLLIAGEGPEERKLKDLSVKYNVQEQVTFLGFVNDFNAFLHSIDVFVLSSVYEGFGYVLIEAMAAGKPVVAFDIGTTSEIIDEEKNGYIVQQGNIDQLADKLELLIQNPSLYKSFKNAGIKKVADSFTLTACFSNLVEFLEQQ